MLCINIKDPVDSNFIAHHHGYKPNLLDEHDLLTDVGRAAFQTC